MSNDHTEIQSLYAYTLQLTRKGRRWEEGIADSSGFIFPELFLKIEIRLIHHSFVQFFLHNPSFGDSFTMHGISVETPWMFPWSVSDGSECCLLEYLVLIFSRFPLTSEQLFSMIGVDNWRDWDEHKIQETLEIQNRIDEFLEVLDFCKCDSGLADATARLVQQTKVYQEHFFSDKKPDRRGGISFEENMTLLAAERFIREGRKIAILDYANPVEPGGGVLRGANDQEAYLCQSSNLYCSLTSENASRYYDDNNVIRSENQFNSMFIGTDQVIYSPGVTVLKMHSAYLLDRKKHFPEPMVYCLDVIACASPFFSGAGYTIPNGDLKYLLKRRIRNILEVAIENEVNVLILGEFGCGAFHLPPETVAEAFRDCMLEPRYIKAFDEVVFAVKREPNQVPSDIIEAFERFFSKFPEINKNGSEYTKKILLRFQLGRR